MFKTIRKGFNLADLGYDEHMPTGEDRFLWFQRTQAQQSTIVKLATNDAIVNGKLKQSLKIITEAAAATLGVSRVGIWLLDEKSKKLTCVDLYEHIAHRHSNGMEVYVNDYPRYFRALRNGRALDAHDAASDPRTSEFFEDYLYPHGITSLLDAPIRVAGNIVGVVSHEHVGKPRVWCSDETNFAGEIADQMAHVLINSKRKTAELALQKAHADLEQRVVERTAELVDEIAERKRAQELLSNSEQSYRALVENAPVCIHEIDLQGKLISVNPKGLAMIGVKSVDDVKGMPYLEIVAREDQKRVGKLFELALRGEANDFEFRAKEADSPRIYASNFIPLRDNAGRIEKVMGYTEDITERKMTEAKDKLLQVQLLHTEKLSSIGLLAAGVAHELNSPLTGLLSLLRTYRKRSQEGTELYQEVTEMLEAAEHMAKIVEDLNQFSRVSKDKFSDLDMHNVIESTLSFSEYPFVNNKIRIIKQYQQDLPKVWGNKSQLQQVVINLVTNAVDAMPNGGDFTITTSFNDEDNCVVLKFQDTGVGIEHKHLPKIFDPFFTTKIKDKGTGLGLSVSHGIVKSHKGELLVESQVGKGSAFTCKLPKYQP